MRTYRLVLVLLCLGLLGAMPFVIGASKPDTAGDQRESTVQGQTPVERQLAAERAQPKVDPIVGYQMEMAFYQAENLANAGKYKEALAALDKLQAIPGAAALLHDKRLPMTSGVEEMRQYVLVKIEGARGSQTR